MGPVHPGCMTAKDELKVGHFTSGAPQDLQEEHPLSFPEYITELIFPLSTIQTLSFFFLIQNAIGQLIYSLCPAILII